MIKPRRTLVVFFLLAVVVLILANCTGDEPAKRSKAAPRSFEDYVGSASCATCHKDICEKHLGTEHYLSTAPASAKNILGSFEEGKNSYAYSPVSSVLMQKKADGFYQTAYGNGQPQRSERMDILVGSGRKGQSFINVKGHRFAQLPITYFTPADQWANSPGYPPYKLVFDRPITARCLECHATFAQQKSSSPNHDEFDPKRVIYGIDCERCHGPAAKHVDYQTKNPQAKGPKFIVNPGWLSRQQNLDLCGLCHGGRLQKTAPSFSFQVGDSLSRFFAPNKNFMDVTNIDVHGNQLGLLSASRCFQLSQLNCTSCHNPHESEKETTALFSRRCQNCHGGEHQKACKLTAGIGPAITQNCIDCHMPKQASHSIAVYLQGAQQPTPVLMRTHWIKVYPEETEKGKALLKVKKTATLQGTKSGSP